MQRYDLSGLEVSVSTPRVVTEGVGHRWFPRIAQFGSGAILVGHTIVADRSDNVVAAGGVHVSNDNGENWQLRYDSSEGAAVKIAQPDGSLAGPSFRSYWDPAAPKTQFQGHFGKLEADGKRVTFEPWAVTVNGLPRDVQVSRTKGQHGRTWQSGLVMHGDAIEVEDGILTTAYLHFEGDDHYSSVALVSADGGRSWEYRSTVADPLAWLESQQGPCEPSMVRLAGGDLMCVMRTGSGREWPLIRTYSNDDGRTWSEVDFLSAFSVDPSLCRLDNDVIFLSAGRPGIDLWFSADPRGEVWQNIDLIKHHNAQLPSPDHRITPVDASDRKQRMEADQTTAYTSVVKISPNQLLLVYDRTPFGWKPVPQDSDERSRVYIVSVEVERR